jgi:hypothetical protein
MSDLLTLKGRRASSDLQLSTLGAQCALLQLFLRISKAGAGGRFGSFTTFLTVLSALPLPRSTLLVKKSAEALKVLR